MLALHVLLLSSSYSLTFTNAFTTTTKRIPTLHEHRHYLISSHSNVIPNTNHKHGIVLFSTTSSNNNNNVQFDANIEDGNNNTNKNGNVILTTTNNNNNNIKNEKLNDEVSVKVLELNLNDTDVLTNNNSNNMKNNHHDDTKNERSIQSDFLNKLKEKMGSVSEDRLMFGVNEEDLRLFRYVYACICTPITLLSVILK